MTVHNQYLLSQNENPLKSLDRSGFFLLCGLEQAAEQAAFSVVSVPVVQEAEQYDKYQGPAPASVVIVTAGISALVGTESQPGETAAQEKQKDQNREPCFPVASSLIAVATPVIAAVPFAGLRKVRPARTTAPVAALLRIFFTQKNHLHPWFFP